MLSVPRQRLRVRYQTELAFAATRTPHHRASIHEVGRPELVGVRLERVSAGSAYRVIDVRRNMPAPRKSLPNASRFNGLPMDDATVRSRLPARSSRRRCHYSCCSRCRLLHRSYYIIKYRHVCWLQQGNPFIYRDLHV